MFNIMFLTRPTFSEWMPPFEGFEDCKAWGAVEISAALPWFVLHIQAATNTEDSFTVTYLLSNLQNVKIFLFSLTQNDRVLGVHAAVPAAYTGQRTWQLTELQEIWEASLSDHGEQHAVWLFTTTAGETLLDPPVSATKKVRRDSLLYRRTDT